MNEQGLRVEDVLRTQGYYVSTTVGISMRPLLRTRKDSIEIRPVQGRLKRLDVPLYRQGDKLILHRVVAVKPDGYVICGDNCLVREENVTDDQIVGVMTAFYRGNRYHSVDERGYRLYAKIWVALFPVRRPFMWLRRCLGAIKHRLFPHHEA